MLSSGDTVRHSSCSRGLTVQREQQAPCKPVTVIWRHDVTLRVGTVWLRVQSYSVWFGECPAGHHIGASIKEDSRWVSGHLPGVLGRKKQKHCYVLSFLQLWSLPWQNTWYRKYFLKYFNLLDFNFMYLSHFMLCDAILAMIHLLTYTSISPLGTLKFPSHF